MDKDQVPLGNVVVINRAAERVTFYLKVGLEVGNKWEKHELDGHADQLYPYKPFTRIKVLSNNTEVSYLLRDGARYEIYVTDKGNLDVRRLIEP
jgi:PAS domain-containing protein